MKKQIKFKSNLHYGMSLAASWAWGVSLIVGMQIIQTKGWIPFIIWATANCLALPLFGFIAYRIPNLEKIVNLKVVLLFMTIITVFCLWIQMNAIYEGLENIGFISSMFSKVIVIIVVTSMSILLYRDGLIKSIFIDNPLWLTCYLILSIIAVYALFANVETRVILKYNSANDINWALNSCLILFSGPIMSIQNWQMAEKLQKENKMKAHYISGVLFAVYMAFVALLATFNFNGTMNLLVMIVILFVALTTADSAIVGMQKIAGNKIGLIIALITTSLWVLVIPMGVMNLWTTMGNLRKYVAGLCIIIAVISYIINRRKVGNLDETTI